MGIYLYQKQSFANALGMDLELQCAIEKTNEKDFAYKCLMSRSLTFGQLHGLASKSLKADQHIVAKHVQTVIMKPMLIDSSHPIPNGWV